MIAKWIMSCKLCGNMIEPVKSLLQRCVSVDLEVDPSTATVFAFASVRDDARPPILAKKRDLVAVLDRLEDENGAYSPLRALA